MSFTCINCGTSLATGNRLCPQCGLTFDQPVPSGQAPRIMLFSTSHAKKANQCWLTVLLVMGIGIMGLMSAGCGTQSPPPPPPPPLPPVSTTGNLVGSWTSNIVMNGSPVQDVYTFNSDNTFSETQTDQAGKSATASGSYTHAGDQVTINSSDGQQEQATVTWDSADQMHYKITKNIDASEVGMDVVRTRQAAEATAAGSTSVPIITAGSNPVFPTTTNPTMSSDTLVQAYLDDPAAADAKYKDQKVTVSGKVVGEPQNSVAFLDTAIPVPQRTDGVSTYNMECDFSSGTDLTGIAPKMSSGHIIAPFFVSYPVTVEGVCRGRRDDGKVRLDNCTLKEVGSPTKVE